jgi:hypothetical protein
MKHVGNKYLRTIYSPIDGTSIQVDVYAVIEAYAVTCPARQHAIKKLLCAGLRGKGSELQDLEEAFNSCGPRAIDMQKLREQNASEQLCDKGISTASEQYRSSLSVSVEDGVRASPSDR